MNNFNKKLLLTYNFISYHEIKVKKCLNSIIENHSFETLE